MLLFCRYFDGRFRQMLRQLTGFIETRIMRIHSRRVAGLLQQIASRKPEVAPAISEVVGQVQAIAQVYGLQVGAGGLLTGRAWCSRCKRALMAASALPRWTTSLRRRAGRSPRHRRCPSRPHRGPS